jgi:predicted enzyme related to lactoylglutathione lyase
MKQPLSVLGVTLEVRVSDFAAGASWYTKLLGQPPDRMARTDFWEWEILPKCYLQVGAGTPMPGSGLVRLGVADVAAERERIQEALGIAISPIERVEGVAAWCTFEDPFGNRLGLFEDLADVSSLDYPPL